MLEGDKNNYKVDEQNKIYIVGGRGVGKTSLLCQIQSGKFSEKITPSAVGIIKSKYINGKGEFTLKDFTDDDSFTTTNKLKDDLEDALLIFVLIALDDPKSFEYAKTLIQFIKNNLISNKELTMVLLGNKYDLVEQNQSEKKVEKREIDNYIHNIDNLYYYNISCKTNLNIDKIKELIDSIEIEEDKDDEDDKIPEEERKEKVEIAKENSCFIY